jgi:glycosyltransferase involved in cell wall biosynthesis
MAVDISVVIPTSRRPVLLTEALASVLRQTGVGNLPSLDGILIRFGAACL